MNVELTKGQLAKINATAGHFGCTGAELIVALAMGNLAMHGRLEGSHGEGIENAENIAEFIEEFVADRRTPEFNPGNLNVSRLAAEGRLGTKGGARHG